MPADEQGVKTIGQGKGGGRQIEGVSPLCTSFSLVALSITKQVLVLGFSINAPRSIGSEY